MAAPSETEIQTMLKNAVDVLEDVRAFGDQNTPNLVDDLDTLVQSVEGDYAQRAASVASQIRAAYSRVQAQDAALLTPILQEYARSVLNYPSTSAAQILTQLYDRLVTNVDTIESRGMALGTPSAGTATGNGDVLRLTVDAQGYVIESGHAETKTAECVADASSGAPETHRETFELRGQDASPDLLEELGSGLRITTNAITHRSAATLANASFNSVSGASASGTALTSAPTSWTLDSGTIGDLSGRSGSANVPRVLDGEATPIALRASGDFSLSQDLGVNRVRLDPNTPYLLGIWLKNNSSATGTLTLTLGATSKAINLTSVGSSWDFYTLDLDEGLWFEQFNASSLQVQVALSSLAVGTLDIDEVILAPGTFFDGSWWWVVGGTTPWLREDTWTASDTDAGNGKIQRHLSRAFGRYLPHVGNATQVTASGGRTLTFAASGKTITASSGSFVTDGFEANATLTVAGTSNNNGAFTIASVTATVLTVNETVVDEGPLSSTATLDAGPSITDP